MVIAYLNYLKDREEAEAKAQRELRAAEAAAKEAARQQLTPEELDNLPAAMRDLLNRYAGDNVNGSDNGTANR